MPLALVGGFRDDRISMKLLLDVLSLIFMASHWICLLNTPLENCSCVILMAVLNSGTRLVTSISYAACKVHEEYKVITV